MQFTVTLPAATGIWLLLFLADTTCAGNEASTVRSNLPPGLERAVVLRGKAYADVSWRLLANLDQIGRDLNTADWPLKEGVAYHALLVRDREPGLFNYRDRIVGDFLRQAFGERMKHLLPDRTEEEQMAEMWGRDKAADHKDNEPIGREKPRKIEIEDKRIAFGSLMDHSWATRSYRRIRTDLVLKDRVEWNEDAAYMMLEMAIFEPYKEQLETPPPRLMPRPDYSMCWFHIAVNIDPPTEVTKGLLMDVLLDVTNDVSRMPEIRALAMERLALVADTPKRMKPVLDLAAQEDAFLRGCALHALGVWVSTHAQAKEEAAVAFRAQAVERLQGRAAKDASAQNRGICENWLTELKAPRADDARAP